MERINRDDAQWIMLIGFIISVGILFLAIIINQSVLVGQTTAESVLEFPKSDIQDLRSEVRTIKTNWAEPEFSEMKTDINVLALQRKNAVIEISGPPPPGGPLIIHYNNGVTQYDENITYWDF